LQAENNRLLSEKQRIKDRVTGLRRQLEIDSSILLPLEQLARQGGAASMDVAEKRRILESTRRDLAESEQSLQSLKFESAKLQSETRLQLLNARTRLEQVVIKAPVRGTVLELKAQTGQVAPANETLLKIVPTDDLQAKVFTPSKDLAFIRPGQEAKIGFTAYDPSIYGYLKGNVSRISEDALPPTPEVNFSNFPVTIALHSQFLETKGKRFALQPGMSLTAQIKLQKRSVLQLIFSRFNHGLDAVRTMR
jgi:HlyD family secretion protein